MAVLLIGSTGHGKSTLGNFLLDPDTKKQYFKVSRNNLSETKEIKVVTGEVKYEVEKVQSGVKPNVEETYQEQAESISVPEQAGRATIHRPLTIIDTPTLNESEENDLRLTIDLFKTLEKQGTILACIFVVKFEAKIDQQYIKTIEYYSNQIPHIFSRNCIIVQTHYATDERSVDMRKERRINEEEIRENVREKIKEYSCMPFEHEPIVFTLNCKPYHESKEEVDTAHRERKDILSKIFSQRPLAVDVLEVAKLGSMLARDEALITHYKQQIVDHNEKMQKANADIGEIVHKVKLKETEITSISVNIAKLEEKMQRMNTDDLSVSKEKIYEKKWPWPWQWPWQEEYFDIESKCEIEEVKQWSNGYSIIKYEVHEQKRVTGVVQGYFMRGLYASITLLAKNRILYKSEISKLSQKISEEKNELSKLQHEKQEMTQEAEQARISLTLLQKFNEEARAHIAELSRERMTINEAELELEKLQQARKTQ